MGENGDAAVIKLRDDAAWRDVDGQVILLDPGSSRYFGVNVAGTLLWATIASGATHQQLVDLLVESFPQAAGNADGDVSAFVDMCRRHNLLQ